MEHLRTVLATMEYEPAGEEVMIAALGGLVSSILGLVVALVMIVSMWKIFTKAGEPGWASIIPIYNVIVLLKVAGKPLWWILLLLVPCANIVVAVLVMISLAEKFGKSVAFGIGLAILGIIFLPILAFGDARYRG